MTAITPLTGSQGTTEPERIERFQSLQAGQYWRARVDLPDDEIPAGMVLLIQSIRWVDDAPHTIILRPHPSRMQRGMEHRCLLQEFLEAFEFEPDHQRIRAEELRKVQGRIAEIQRELAEIPDDPSRLALAIQASGEGEATPSPSLLPAPGATSREEEAATSLATGTVAAAMASGLTPERIEAMKEAAGRQLTLATAKARWIEKRTKELATTVQAMTPFFEEQVAATLAQTEDVQNYVAKLLSGIESLDLYVGNGVSVRTLREGAHAAAGEPLTILQRKLKMDEELAVFVDVDEWFDFGQQEAFFDAIRQHAGLVDQIFPTPRCVLVMATTHRHIDYGNDLATRILNEHNREVFLLVRNGDNVHQVHSPVESHLRADRLFPNRDEASRVFRGIDGSKIKFEDVAYTDRLQRHEMAALHYKRFLILLCGLDHRIKLFGDFYEGPPSMDFVSTGFQERHMRFIHDDDAGQMIAGGFRKPVNEWITEMNEGIVAGSRILCRWADLMTPETAPSACEYAGRDGMRVEFNFVPDEGVSLVQAEIVEGEPTVKVSVTGHKRTGPGYRTFNCRVHLNRSPYKGLRAGYICLDAVSPEDLRWYIQHRASREHQLEFIRLFKRGLKHLESEYEAQRPTRARMLEALREGAVGEESERPAIVDRAVQAWRSANRGKELPNAGGPSPAWTQLLDQMFALARGGEGIATNVAGMYRSVGWEPLRLVSTGKGQLAVYVAPTAEECDDRLEAHAWVRRIVLERRRGGSLAGGATSWVQLPRALTSETTLHQWPAAAAWIDRQTVFKSLEQKTEMFAFAQEKFEQLSKFAAPMSAMEAEHQIVDWSGVWRDANRILRATIVNPGMAIPIGITIAHGKPRYLCVGSPRPHEILAALATDDSVVHEIADIYSETHENRASARARVIEAHGQPPRWVLMTAEDSLMKKRSYGVYGHHRLGCSIEELTRYDDTKPLLDDAVRAYLTRNSATWLAEGAMDSTGRLRVDESLGHELPSDFHPTEIQIVKLEGVPPGCLSAWIDLFSVSDKVAQSAGVDEQASAVAPGRTGWSATGQRFATQDLALQAMLDLAAQKNRRAVPAQEIEGAPLPPQGRRRWYLV